MKKYRNENHDFEMETPDEWGQATENKVGIREYSLVFQCRPLEAFNIQIGPILPEPSLEETERNFQAYSDRQGYAFLALGRIQAAGKSHVWARYLMANGTWTKKYLLVFDGIEYALTASCHDQKFLLEMEKSWDALASAFRKLSASSFDLQAVMLTLARPATLSEIPHRIELCQQALTHIDRHKDPVAWAGLQIELSKSLAQNPQGDPAQKIEQAILHNQNALEVFMRETDPEVWANIQINLASNYRNRLLGNKAENIEISLRLCTTALEVLNIRDHPLLWASAHNNLANSYRDRPLGNRADNIEQCIHHCRQALHVFNRHAYARLWATVQNNLGNAYQDRALGDRGANLEEALASYQQALQVFTYPTYAEDWAWTQSNIGAIYHLRISGNTVQNLEMSIQHSNQALRVFHQDTHPEKWAVTNLNLGGAFFGRQTGDRIENLRQSLENFMRASMVFTQGTYPDYWEKTQKAIATVNQQLQSLEESQAITINTAFNGEEDFSKLAYNSIYLAAIQQSADERRHLKLIFTDLPDIKYATNMLMVYQWEGPLSIQEADRLRLRAAIYLATAIYDAAMDANIPCRLSPIPNGQRPAWIIEGEASPISVTLTEANLSDRTLQLSLGPVIVAIDVLSNKELLKKLMQSIQKRFSMIVV